MGDQALNKNGAEGHPGVEDGQADALTAGAYTQIDAPAAGVDTQMDTPAAGADKETDVPAVESERKADAQAVAFFEIYPLVSDTQFMNASESSVAFLPPMTVSSLGQSLNAPFIVLMPSPSSTRVRSGHSVNA